MTFAWPWAERRKRTIFSHLINVRRGHILADCCACAPSGHVAAESFNGFLVRDIAVAHFVATSALRLSFNMAVLENGQRFVS
jgi:hypothetical protein